MMLLDIWFISIALIKAMNFQKQKHINSLLDLAAFLKITYVNNNSVIC